MIKATAIFFGMIVLGTAPIAFADSEKIEFAGYLEETLGHFWALEQNLDDKNAELALVHATHPIAELYDLMRPQLQTVDPQLDSQIKEILLDLQNKANTKVSREQAQSAIDDAKQAVKSARNAVVGEELSSSVETKLVLMKGLLETSIAEYGEAVSDGMITEMAEFQDGSAFVWRSQQIFNEVESELPEHEVEEIDELYESLWSAYDNKANPVDVETLAGGIIHEIDEILGIEDEESGLLAYVDTIEDLLEETKTEYSAGNSDVALSLATKAYLDNYEFIEGPLAQSGNAELMHEVEILLREELRNMIKTDAPASEINAKVDLILKKIESIEEILETVEPSQTSSKMMHQGQMMHKGQEMRHYPPHMQVRNGINPSDVTCNNGMELMMRVSNGAPVCLKPSSVERLMMVGFCDYF
ncbi:PEFG-CTERM sorting domain-containing protein [Nitrosopumilus sp. K4]|uniref:PEFG-CTERM sorting domain-containing protein n=1 Tax=Nitrosopumilus sp. K4 TaxID=2795383 RepID=UPI001BA765C2|nr:PEFG-CTERM sorting domain-containing protein [Nitrosopumilus sp. K4]QUC64136.1 PEFG-CTERM sorting domain-containing protein [Nitrosopumilus sp. K4]